MVRRSITGLVGTNGSGKTSLAKATASKEIPNFPQSLSIQYVSSHESYAFNESQHVTLKPLEYMSLIAQEQLANLNTQIQALEEKLENEDIGVDIEEIANELAELYDRQEEFEASSEREIQQTVDTLAFSKFLEKPVSQLSC